MLAKNLFSGQTAYNLYVFHKQIDTILVVEKDQWKWLPINMGAWLSIKWSLI